MKISLVKDINLLNTESFDRLIVSHPNGNFFQSLKAFRLFSSVENFKPVLIIAEEAGEVVGSLLASIIRENNIVKGYLSRRCIIYGGPIIKDNNFQTANSLLQYFDRIINNRVIYTEFRELYEMNEFDISFKTYGYEYEDHLNFIVPICSIIENKKLLSSSKKRQINLSLRNGAEIVEPENISDVETFYELLNNLYKKKIKKPLAGFSLFKEFYLNKELGKYFLIKYEGRIMGGMMCPIYGDTIYEWFVCGLDGEFKNIYPSVLATWAPIEYAVNNGLKYFDFLGAGKPDVDYGVREFKSKFGGKLVNYGRYIKVHNKALYNIGKFGLEVIGKIK